MEESLRRNPLKWGLYLFCLIISLLSLAILLISAAIGLYYISVWAVAIYERNLPGLSVRAVDDGSSVRRSTKPNIVIISLDDLGWNDVSFHGYSEIPTPNIDRLAQEGVILNSFYAQSQCTPSRSALMTARYPIRHGLQQGIIRNGEPRGLPLTEKILPQYLKELGYSTHLIGKWHLGYYQTKMLPTNRGFDSFFGSHGSSIDHFNHAFTYDDVTVKYSPGRFSLRYQSPPGLRYLYDDVLRGCNEQAGNSDFHGLDLWNNTEPARNHTGQYITTLLTDVVVQRITTHDFVEGPRLVHRHLMTVTGDVFQPLFLHLSHVGPHVSNGVSDLQVPQQYVNRFPNILHPGRQKYAGIVSALDDSVGEVIQALERQDALNNTIVFFFSDNGGGGEEQSFLPGRTITYASNWPLRGAKNTPFEGGIRVTAFAWSPRIQTPGRVSTELYHVTDLLPTLVHVAGGSINSSVELDGHNIWPSLSEDLPSPRNELLIQADSLDGEYALRWNQYKVMSGLYLNDNGQSADDWYEPSGGLNTSLLTDTPGKLYCNRTEMTFCFPDLAPCLFDVVADPCERNNIALQHPHIVQLMMDKLASYNNTAAPPGNLPIDERSNPKYHGGLLAPWGD